MAGQSYLGIAEASELIRQRTLSPVELVKECLDRIRRLNPALNAFITVTGDQAGNAAVAAEKEIADNTWRGPLHGIPVAIKDMFDTAGVRTTGAFEAYRNRVPDRDAEAVARLKEAGAIILGKTNMHELAMGTTSVASYFGSVRNPWNRDYIAGGSSGGSSAAVAAGLCFATLDTDAIGSCRLPAAICGITGFKATYGLIPTGGILEGEKADDVIVRLAHTAFQCRSARDAAILLAVLAHPDTGESRYSAGSPAAPGLSKNPRVGIAKDYRATGEVREVFGQAVDTLRSMGCRTRVIDAPVEFSGIDLRHVDEDRQSITKSLFRTIDVLVLPTTTDVTPGIPEARAMGPLAVSADNTYFCNYYGLPAASIPCGFSKNGLPLGIQLVGPRWGEASVLEIAQRFQDATGWHLRHPPCEG